MRILFVHKENKNNDFIQQFLLFRDRLQCAFTRVPRCIGVHSSACKQGTAHAFCFLCTQIIFVASKNYSWTTDVKWTILTMSLLPFWALNVSVALLSMRVRKLSDFIRNILICVSNMNKGLTGSERINYSWGWVINDRIYIFGWTIPLMLRASVL